MSVHENAVILRCADRATAHKALGARVELAVAHRAERSEPHLARTVGTIQAMF